MKNEKPLADLVKGFLLSLGNGNFISRPLFFWLWFFHPRKV